MILHVHIYMVLCDHRLLILLHFINFSSLPIFSIAVCTVRGDPYPMESLLTPWLNHQLVSGHEGDTAAMFVRNAIDKQHRTCTLTFHSALSKCNTDHV